MTTPANWMDKLAYPSNKYYKLVQKYCDAFKAIFRCELRAFGYERWMKDGAYIGITNIPEINDIYFESEGYKENPFFVQYDFVLAGSIFFGPNYTKDYECYNQYRNMLQKKLDIYTTFSIIEKTKNYYDDFCWDFRSPAKTLTIQQEKIIILEDFANNYSLIQAILTQFKTEFFPIIKREELCNVNIKELNTIYHKNNELIHQNTRTNDPNFLSNTNLIQANDLKLMQVNFIPLEETILNLYIRGMTADEIGNHMSHSRETVKLYITTIKNKVGCNKRSEVYEMAEKLKLMRIMSGIS